MITQQDTIFAPIIQGLIMVAGQIEGLGNLYSEVPDAPPENNSVIFAPIDVDIRDDETNGKLVIRANFEIDHLFARARLQDNLASIQAAFPAWLTAITAWPNQTLGGLVQNVNFTKARIHPYTHGNQQYLSLSMTVQVRFVQNILMN